MVHAAPNDCTAPTVTTTAVTKTLENYFRVTGTISLNGSPLCGLVLANGQFMFTCGDPLPEGNFDLTVPLDNHGQITLFGFSSGLAPFQRILVPQVMVEDFKDMVTTNDKGINDFSGNSGDINKDGLSYGASEILHTDTQTAGLRFSWDFTKSSDSEAYTGLFFCLFGLCDTLGTFSGDPDEQQAETLVFREHSLNLDQVDGVVAEPGGPRSLNKLQIALTYGQSTPLMLRVELKDTHGGGRFTRFPIRSSSVLTWDFRNSYTVIGGQDLDLQQTKVLSLVVERNNVGDQVSNPVQGSFDLKQVWFVPSSPELEPTDDEASRDLLERRAFQYFVDWSSRTREWNNDPNRSSYGIPQDRSSFGDLLTVGGIGFALPAYLIGSERGWISRAEAIERTRAVLRVLSDEAAFGSERVGRIGYKGFFYHFLGVDGRRKLNFDYAATPVDESKNTVELSTIDTGLALMGVLAAQSYFFEDQEIYKLAQAIYDRVDWQFMLEPQSQRFYLGWKPNEEREGDPYLRLDEEGKGQYSGTLDQAAVLDYYTDEALIVILLAVGSTTHPVPPEVYCNLIRRKDENGLIRTYPGSLFTYEFLQAFLNTHQLYLRCPGEPVDNWFYNSKLALYTVMDYITENPDQYPTYSQSAWGVSAAEGPSDRYHAYGAKPVAVALEPDQDGTVTYYSALSALGFAVKDNSVEDQSLYATIQQTLDSAWQRGHWHWRFALPDAFSEDISHAANLDAQASWVRRAGPWVQRALFAIDQGPMLLHLENARSGLIWQQLATNPNIQRGVNKLIQQ